MSSSGVSSPGQGQTSGQGFDHSIGHPDSAADELVPTEPFSDRNPLDEPKESSKAATPPHLDQSSPTGGYSIGGPLYPANLSSHSFHNWSVKDKEDRSPTTEDQPQEHLQPAVLNAKDSPRDHQTLLMLLEQQNKKRLQLAKNEDAAVSLESSVQSPVVEQQKHQLPALEPPAPTSSSNMNRETIGKGSWHPTNRALHDYQLQLMLLERQNKKRLLMARQEDNLAKETGVSKPPESKAAKEGCPVESPHPKRQRVISATTALPGHMEGTATSNHALQDYQMQLMLWEQQKRKKRLLQAQLEQQPSSTEIATQQTVEDVSANDLPQILQKRHEDVNERISSRTRHENIRDIRSDGLFRDQPGTVHSERTDRLGRPEESPPDVKSPEDLNDRIRYQRETVERAASLWEEQKLGRSGWANYALQDYMKQLVLLDQLVRRFDRMTKVEAVKTTQSNGPSHESSVPGELEASEQSYNGKNVHTQIKKHRELVTEVEAASRALHKEKFEGRRTLRDYFENIQKGRPGLGLDQLKTMSCKHEATKLRLNARKEAAERSLQEFEALSQPPPEESACLKCELREIEQVKDMASRSLEHIMRGEGEYGERRNSAIHDALRQLNDCDAKIKETRDLIFRGKKWTPRIREGQDRPTLSKSHIKEPNGGPMPPGSSLSPHMGDSRTASPRNGNATLQEAQRQAMHSQQLRSSHQQQKHLLLAQQQQQHAMQKTQLGAQIQAQLQAQTQMLQKKALLTAQEDQWQSEKVDDAAKQELDRPQSEVAQQHGQRQRACLACQHEQLAQCLKQRDNNVAEALSAQDRQQEQQQDESSAFNDDNSRAMGKINEESISKGCDSSSTTASSPMEVEKPNFSDKEGATKATGNQGRSNQTIPLRLRGDNNVKPLNDKEKDRRLEEPRQKWAWSMIDNNDMIIDESEDEDEDEDEDYIDVSKDGEFGRMSIC